VASQRAKYSHDLFTAEALQFVERNRERPFFLYLAYTIPHVNNELSRARPDRNGLEVPDDKPYSDRPWPQAQKNQAAMITRLDTDIGRLIDKLKELKIDERTIVFFSSDNGPCKEGGADPDFFHSSGGLRGCKRDLYEGGIRVPMIVRWPGRIRAGQTSDAVWAFWDFLPTAAELAGVKPPENIGGVSMVPVLHGKDVSTNERFLYWEFHERGFTQAVRWKDWKAVRHGRNKPIELYDLKTDRAETKDMAAEHGDVVRRIEEYLQTARSESKDWVPRER
jgi:arylsulfatase A-like enzyme